MPKYEHTTIRNLLSGIVLYTNLMGSLSLCMTIGGRHTHPSSKGYYNYMFKLILATENDGNPFPTIPSVVPGNIINQTNSNNYAFCVYFSQSEVDTKRYKIK